MKWVIECIDLFEELKNNLRDSEKEKFLKENYHKWEIWKIYLIIQVLEYILLHLNWLQSLFPEKFFQTIYIFLY